MEVNTTQNLPNPPTNDNLNDTVMNDVAVPATEPKPQSDSNEKSNTTDTPMSETTTEQPEQKVESSIETSQKSEPKPKPVLTLVTPDNITQELQMNGTFDKWRGDVHNELEHNGIFKKIEDKVLTILQNSTLLKQYQQDELGSMNKRQLLEGLKREIQKAAVTKELRQTIQRTLYSEGVIPSEISQTVEKCAIKIQNEKEGNFLEATQDEKSNITSSSASNQSNTSRSFKRKVEPQQQKNDIAKLLAPGGAVEEEDTKNGNDTHSPTITNRKRVFKELFGDSSSSGEEEEEIENEAKRRRTTSPDPSLTTSMTSPRKRSSSKSSSSSRPNQAKTRVGVKTLFDAGYLNAGDKVSFRSNKKNSSAVINADGLIEWVNPIDSSVQTFSFVSQFSTAVDRTLKPVGSFQTSHNGWNNTYIEQIKPDGSGFEDMIPIREVRDRYLAAEGEQVVEEVVTQSDGLPPTQPQGEEEEAKRKRTPSSLLKDNSELERYKQQERQRHK
ncbi:hypothetical protein AKO1_013413 [Acrasis kona]|uniref:BOD1/SHG1 domain-containing protein n=1 Tax=Acrasis kona TaxID=1008807 RepID=A0AAW2YLE9_9EUKA